jgi:hypothetical protein
MCLQVFRNVCSSTAEAKISSGTVWRVLTASSTTVSVAVALVAQVGTAFLHTVFSSFQSHLNKECKHTICISLSLCLKRGKHETMLKVVMTVTFQLLFAFDPTLHEA